MFVASVIIQLRTFSRTSFTADINLDRGSPRDERGSVPPRVSKKRRKTRSDQSSFCSARQGGRGTSHQSSIRNAKWNSDYPSITESNHFIRTWSLGRLCGLGLPTLSTGRGWYPFVVAAGIPEAFKELEQGLSLPQSSRVWVGLKDTRIPSKEGYERVESTLSTDQTNRYQTNADQRIEIEGTGIIVSDT